MKEQILIFTCEHFIFQVPGAAQVLPAAAEPRWQQRGRAVQEERDRAVLRLAPLRRLRRPLAAAALRQVPRPPAGHRSRPGSKDQARSGALASSGSGHWVLLPLFL